MTHVHGQIVHLSLDAETPEGGIAAAQPRRINMSDFGRRMNGGGVNDRFGSANGLSPRYWRERSMQTEPGNAEEDQPVTPAQSTRNLLDFSETTSQLRHRILDAAADDGPRLRISVALPIIVVLSMLPWVAMAEVLDMHVISTIAALIAQ